MILACVIVAVAVCVCVRVRERGRVRVREREGGIYLVCEYQKKIFEDLTLPDVCVCVWRPKSILTPPSL